jgi:epoxyqueuosine reductase
MKLTNKIVIEKARQIGFDLIGFAKADPLQEEAVSLELWLNKNYHAGMDYMERNFNKRKDVKKILPGAKSVISLGLNYYTSDTYSGNEINLEDSDQIQQTGKISRYAWGKDYHLIIWAMLDEIVEEFKSIDRKFKSLSYVDTGPVMDKAWAVRSGIGWLGKHTNVINREIGSWFFIANIVTNYEFDYSDRIPDFCGSCKACIDACPTDAIIDEYLIDSKRCISYLTIENRNIIPDEFKGKFDGWLFGCDICQDVCPWNKKFSVETLIGEFHPKKKELLLDEVSVMKEEEFISKFKQSSVKRAKLSGLKRNAAFLKNR